MPLIEETDNDKAADAAINEQVAGLDLNDLIAQAAARHGHGPSTSPGFMAPELPAAIAGVKNMTTDEFLKTMNKMPLFMTELDETNAEGTGENIELEALKALAYEGEPHEVAQNFRNQGNDNFKVKQYRDAVEFYTKALAVKCGVAEIETACLTNRAACNLELKNYRRCITDCKLALHMAPANTKAWYRSAKALYALEKLPEAMQCISAGLETAPDNAALLQLQAEIAKKQNRIAEIERVRKEREDKALREAQTLRVALLARKIPVKVTPQPPELEDATLHLEDPTDPKSTLCFPTVFLYPLSLQSDFIKAFPENSTLAQQLSMVLAEPCPWDSGREYFPATKVDAYMETATGGLIKVGKKVPLFETLGGGKVLVVDQILTVLLVPRARTEEFVKDWKRKHPTPAK
ncbi:hypothetical protein DFP73DRAFT_546973 [Morchella snyderi]|nr:hypothetical protein DFP73DRAFT_546973 [Morchella snyderi]